MFSLRRSDFGPLEDSAPITHFGQLQSCASSKPCFTYESPSACAEFVFDTKAVFLQLSFCDHIMKP